MNEHEIEKLNLPVPEEFCLPAYGGGSIANVPATVARLLAAPFRGLPGLPEPLWQPVAGVKRVVLLTLDGFGLNLFQERQE